MIIHCWQLRILRQQCKGNPLLRFHGNTQRLYTADSYVYFNNSAKGTHCCVSMEKLNDYTLLTASVLRQQCKGNPLLRFHGNTQRLYTAYSYVNNNTKGKHFCVSIATMVVTFYVLCLSCCVQYLWRNSCFECWTYSSRTAMTLTLCNEKYLSIRLRDLNGKWGTLAGIVPSIRTGWTAGTTWCLKYSGSNFGHLK